MRGGDKNTFDCLFLVFKDVIIAGSYAPHIYPPNLTITRLLRQPCKEANFGVDSK